ncbi:MAG: hypothetical protein CML07_01210 [Psychrobacter sp.]|nr:hypothetical protein [Psychrobacter sp.]
MLMDKALEEIVQRIFVEHQSTLLVESAEFEGIDLADTCLGLRGQMFPCLKGLPILAFEPDPSRQPGEVGWTAGEIVSTNSDRLLWALTEAATTAGLGDSSLPQVPEVVASNAAYEPRLLDRDLALEVLQKANEHVKTALPPLLAADCGQTAARTHHGVMSVRSWLLLICIHDWDHLGQVRARQELGTSGR